jgi:hypothetical protein
MTTVANKSKKTTPATVAPEAMAERLLGDIRELISQARTRVAQAVNAGQVLLNWHIGQSLHTEILGEQRAEYGKQIVQTVSAQLMLEYGRGYGRTNLFNMVRFAETFPDVKIVQTLSEQLSWTHLLESIC